jgi:hypothetical protein
MRMILPPLVFPGGTLRVRACFMLARIMDKCSPQGCAHPLYWPERVSEKDREREINREREREREINREREKKREREGGKRGYLFLKGMAWHLLVI